MGARCVDRKDRSIMAMSTAANDAMQAMKYRRSHRSSYSQFKQYIPSHVSASGIVEVALVR